MRRLPALHQDVSWKPRIAGLIAVWAGACAGIFSPAEAAQLDAVWVGGTGDWNAASNWDPADVPQNGAGGTYNVFIDNLDIFTASAVTLNVNATVDNLTVDAGDRLTLPNIRILTLATGPAAGALTNAGEVSLNSAGNFTDIRFDGGVVTLSGGGTILLSNSANNRLMGINLGSLVNVDNVIRGAGQIGVDATAITNSGAIIADQPTELVIDPSTTALVNTGILRAEAGGTLRLSNGDFLNAGGVIEAADGSLVLLSATGVSGGTLASAGSGAVRAVSGTSLYSTMHTLTNAGRLEAMNGVDVRLFGDLVNSGTIALLSSGTATELECHDGPVELTGGGIVALGNHVSNRIIGVNGGSLVNVSNTIRGAGQIGVNTMAITNMGTITADASVSLTLDPLGSLVNEGTLAAEAGATLRLVNGSFENDSGRIESRDASAVELSSATVVGGELAATGTGRFRAVSANELNGQASAVTLSGPFEIQTAGVVTVRGSLVNNFRMDVNSTGVNTDLRIADGPTTLSGGGIINLSNNTGNRIVGASGGSLANMDNTIRGSGQIGANTLEFANHGVIIADQAATLTLDPAVGAMVNTGVLRAEDGATMRLVNGAFDNAAGSIEAADGSLVDISNATFIGGAFATTGSGVIRVNPAATFDGTTTAVENAGRIELVNNADVTFTGQIVNSGVIHIASTGSFTDFEPTAGPLFLSGSGQLTMSNNVNNRILGVSGGALVNVDNTISGSGQIGFNITPITNQGTIVANQPATLTLNPDNTMGLTNSGTLLATAGATMNIGDGPFTTSGSVTVEASSTISRIGGLLQTGGTTTVNGTLSATALIEIQGGALRGSGTVSGNVSSGGTVQPGQSTGQLAVSGTFAQSASGLLDIEIAGAVPGAQHDVLAVGGAATLDGTLRVRFVNGFVPTIGQSFTVMTYASRSGTFSAVDVPCSGVSVRVLATSVVVDVTGEVGFFGDMNCDCAVNVFDIEPFVLALLDPVAYAAAYPTCAHTRADANGDTVIDAADTQTFIDLVLP